MNESLLRGIPKASFKEGFGQRSEVEHLPKSYFHIHCLDFEVEDLEFQASGFKAFQYAKFKLLGSSIEPVGGDALQVCLPASQESSACQGREYTTRTCESSAEVSGARNVSKADI